MIVVVLVVVALLVFWVDRSMGVGVLMQRVVLELRTLGPVVFFTAMAILPALGFPLLPFALAAGPVFSPILGTGGVVACAIAAVSLNVSLSYLLAATVFRPPVQWLVRRLGYQLPDPSQHNPWLITLLLRVVPGPPFWMQSYVLGLVRVRFRAYIVVSTVVPAGYLASAIIFGDAMVHGKAGAAFVAASLFVVIGTGFYFIRKKLAAKTTPSTSSNG